METRLKTRAGNTTPLANSNSQKKSETAAAAGDDKASQKSRPGTAKAAEKAPGSGNMPPTPGGSEGDYYLITKDDLNDETR